MVLSKIKKNGNCVIETQQAQGKTGVSIDVGEAVDYFTIKFQNYKLKV